MTEQAYRYNKDTWTAAQARAHCAAHDGTFEVASPATQQEETYQTYQTGTSQYQIEKKTHQGKPHLVVPVVMMVEGVHNGSHGPLLHLADELGRYPESWNGIPVTIGHPEEGGQNISANNPGVIDSQVVGRVYETRIDGSKLRAKVWLDEERLHNISPEAFQYIQEGRPLDVSVGVFTDEEGVSGDWNGEHYEAVARNHRPDHLALLPGGVGACSWIDGCGIRINSKKGGNNDVKNQDKKSLKELAIQGYATIPISVQQEGYRQRIESIQQKLDSYDTEEKTHYLQEVYDDYVIYEVRKRNSNGVETKLYKRNYTIDSKGIVEFADDLVEVRRQISYVTMDNGNKERSESDMFNFKSTKEMERTKTPCKVDQLIAHKSTQFEESDREWLSKQPDEVLDKLFPKEKEVNTNTKPPEKEPEPTMEKALEVLKTSLKKPEDFLKLVPDEYADAFKSGLKLNNERRTTMIKEITENTAEGTWTEDELKEMNTDTLIKIHKSIKKTEEPQEGEDYSAVSGSYFGTYSKGKAVEPLLPAGVEIESEKK